MNKNNENLIKAIKQFDKEFNKPVCSVSHGTVYGPNYEKECYELDALIYDMGFNPIAKKCYYFEKEVSDDK